MTDQSSIARQTVADARHGRHTVPWSSHTALMRTDLRSTPTPTRPGGVDAVVVPTARGAAALDGAANLAAQLDATLVALCSRESRADAAVRRVARYVGCRTVAVDVPTGYGHDLLPTRTLAPRFRVAGPDGGTDLSVKRNIGLLLARLLGWGKIVFLDDDIGVPTPWEPSGLPRDAVRRLAGALDRHQIAGLTCNRFPDNSVVCHARRLAGFDQATFVSGAAVGVNCHDHPLPFFPEQYNEDWFFFSRRVAAREIAHVGDVVQESYDPFADPQRARREEFGDLLAEGLFTLFERQPGEMNYRERLDEADVRYWERFIADRRDEMNRTRIGLADALDDPAGDAGRIPAALRSLGAAGDQLSTLTPDLCVDFLDAWFDDLVGWERATARISEVPTTGEAMDYLGLGDWCAANAIAATRGACA